METGYERTAGVTGYNAEEGGAMESGLGAWFAVSGDMDDFIFFDAPDRTQSEK